MLPDKNISHGVDLFSKRTNVLITLTMKSFFLHMGSEKILVHKMSLWHGMSRQNQDLKQQNLHHFRFQCFLFRIVRRFLQD